MIPEKWYVVETTKGERFAAHANEIEVAGVGFLKLWIAPPDATALAPNGTVTAGSRPWQLILSPDAVTSLVPVAPDVAIDFARNASYQPVSEWEIRPQVPPAEHPGPDVKVVTIAPDSPLAAAMDKLFVTTAAGIFDLFPPCGDPECEKCAAKRSRAKEAAEKAKTEPKPAPPPSTN